VLRVCYTKRSLLATGFGALEAFLRICDLSTRQDIGEPGAIAVIRTFLNFFLERDLEKYTEPGSEPEKK